MSAVAVIWSWRSSASVTIRSSATSTSSCAARWIADSAGGGALICECLRSRACSALLLALHPRLPALADELSPL